MLGVLDSLLCAVVDPAGPAGEVGAAGDTPVAVSPPSEICVGEGNPGTPDAPPTVENDKMGPVGRISVLLSETDDRIDEDADSDARV